MLVGLDIGGTKIEGVGLVWNEDHQRFETLVTHRVATDKSSYEAFLATTLSVIHEVAKSGEIESVGIGCCGSVGPDGLMQGANILVLNGQDFIGDICQQIDVPVAIANDADCFALSEFKDGAAKEAEHSCVAMIIGTGCGSGVILNKGLITGLNKLGGEIGHNPLPHFDKEKDGEAVQCYCGSMNCNEAFLSGTGFERLYKAKYQESLTSKEIMQKYHQGDLTAQAHFELYCDQLARVLASMINFIDPEVIVLGGGMSNIKEIYPLVEDNLQKYTFTKKVKTKVVANVHGDSSGVRGAAFLHLDA